MAYFLIPSVGWAIARRPGLLRLVPVATSAFLLGLTPLLAFNVMRNWASLNVPDAAVETSYGFRLGRFFTTGLPMALGHKIPYEGSWTFPLAFIVFGGVLVALVIALLRTLPQRGGSPRSEQMLAAMVASYPLIFAVSERQAIGLRPFLATPNLPNDLLTCSRRQSVGYRQQFVDEFIVYELDRSLWPEHLDAKVLELQ